ncbi:MAG: hypothetical protein K6F75_06180 [Butyrivibrio sp.]|nr:hypothetical protein [Butyrivibrio sp.]
MIRRMQYRCSFKILGNDNPLDNIIDRCRERFEKLIKESRVCNASFYRYENMGFLYVEEILGEGNEESFAVNKFSGEGLLNVDNIMSDLDPYLKPWPREDGDVYFAPMINVYYHHIPENDIDKWENYRTTDKKQRIGRIAFVFPDKLPSYVMYHNAIVEEGLLKGDKYAFISMHENLLFSYYEEPRNNVNIRDCAEESKVINDWLKANPESHFDRDKAGGNNFLVIPCLFSLDRVDFC